MKFEEGADRSLGWLKVWVYADGETILVHVIVEPNPNLKFLPISNREWRNIYQNLHSLIRLFCD